MLVTAPRQEHSNILYCLQWYGNPIHSRYICHHKPVYFYKKKWRGIKKNSWTIHELVCVGRKFQKLFSAEFFFRRMDTKFNFLQSIFGNPFVQHWWVWRSVRLDDVYIYRNGLLHELCFINFLQCRHFCSWMSLRTGGIIMLYCEFNSMKPRYLDTGR